MFGVDTLGINSTRVLITGKNDGEVKGKRYFEVQTNHGIFVRLSGVTLVAPGMQIPA